MEEFVLPNNYIFNEQQKRVEPLEKKCVYCYKNQMENINDCYFAPVFMTKDRTNLLVYRSVKYAKILIGNPRCKSCVRIHENAKVKGVLISILAGIMIFVFGLMCMSIPMFLIGFFGGIFTAVFGSFYLKNWFVERKGIEALKEAPKGNELIRKFLLAGWSLKQPNA